MVNESKLTTVTEKRSTKVDRAMIMKNSQRKLVDNGHGTRVDNSWSGKVIEKESLVVGQLLLSKND